MNSHGRIAALGAIALLVSGCGGGGSSPSSSTASAVVPTSKTPVATGTLTIRYPTGFHTASTTVAQSLAHRRSAAYINPSPAGYSGQLDIFINGTDAITVTPSPSLPDGTQTIANIPLYSGQDQVVAIETENGYNSGTETILAIGETDLYQGGIGGTISINLTMQQNVSNIGLMTDPADANNDASVSATYTSPHECTISNGSTITVYPFATDPLNGFAVNNGAGGSAVPALSSFSDPQTYGNLTNFNTVNAATSGSLTGYTITFESGNGGQGTLYNTILNLSVPNQAAVISYDARYGYGQFPGIDALFQTGVLPAGALDSLNTQNPYTRSITVEPAENSC